MAVSEKQNLPKHTDWANLPKNIIDSIIEKSVPPLSQFIRFGSVCKAWHAAITENRSLRSKILKRCHHQVPFLMITKSQEKRGLYNIIEKKLHGVELSVPYKRRCCGSSYGWIATVDWTLAIKLINPFTGGIIDLPSVDIPVVNKFTKEDEHEFHVKKVILSDDPYVNPDNFMVLALFGASSSVAIIRPGEKTWTYTSNLETIAKDDAIFHKGKFYAVDFRLGIISVQVANMNGSLVSAFDEKIIIPPEEEGDNAFKYIVESSDGELLIVQRFISTYGPYRWTTNFKVLKLRQHANHVARLVEVKNIGDDALFLGDNCSMSVAASRFPECRPNSIYFTDDTILYTLEGSIDMGIFSLETGCFQPFDDMDPSHSDMPPPFFILPTLVENRVTHPCQY
ncbi:hypothetical protein ERO13_A11G013450v2 [Gossypium hirsutum]|uniref:F-box protein At2g17036 n=1 Tax=Gossypium hirsutum TaxID=3635 RepID=A0A1U8L888_GOSHI|nr:F-box protein At2g17036-like [Gossypium hirsutum]KAG4172698.1 hypothetical protein ERO13_A11G013450v2 [Gossypium hirsutum]